MTISRVGTAFNQSTSVTLPTHQAGDLIVVFAFRSTNNTIPTSPAGWLYCKFQNAAGTAAGSMVAWKVATSSGEVSGTWTDAEYLAAVVYRDDANYLVLGGAARSTFTSSSSVVYPGMPYVSDVPQRSNTSWVGAFVGVKSATSDAHSLAPTGMTNVSSQTGTGRAVGIHDTNAVATWLSNVTATANASVTGHTFAFEVLDSGIAKASGGGGGNLINNQSLVRGLVL